MEERYEEGLIKGSIVSITIEKTQTILEQMKICICKVFGKKIGTGFFCKISYKNKIIPVMITNYHIIDDDFIENNQQIKISINDKYQIININKKRKIYSSIKDKYDLMIIKLNKNEINNYLEIDDNIYNDNSESFYKNESIYILHYPNGGNVSVSYGYGIETINEYDIKHKCNTELGSSGGPILNLQTNKIIGFHKGFIKRKNENDNFSIGTFLKFPLNEINNANTLSSKKTEKLDLQKEKNAFISKTPSKKRTKVILKSNTKNNNNLFNYEYNKDKIDNEINNINKAIESLEKKIKSIEKTENKNKINYDINNDINNKSIKNIREISSEIEQKKHKKKKAIHINIILAQNDMRKDNDIMPKDNTNTIDARLDRNKSNDIKLKRKKKKNNIIQKYEHINNFIFGKPNNYNKPND